MHSITLPLKSSRRGLSSSSLMASTVIVSLPLERAAEQLLGERVLEEVLDRPAQRPGAEVGVGALLDQELLGLVGQHELQAAAPCSRLRTFASSMSMICFRSSFVRRRKTMMSSRRLRNSGRKYRSISLLAARSFIFS